jgi:hypothetical protein
MKVRWIAGVVLASALAMLAFAGCQWAKFTESHEGPQAAVTKGQAPAADGCRYVQIGTGRWVDTAGREHVEPVYVRTGPAGVRGETGPTGPVGTASRPIPLEDLADAGKRTHSPVAYGEVIVTPTPGTSYDARAGTYKREVTVVAPPWGDAPAKAVTGVQPFKTEGVTLPKFRDDGTSLGEGGGGEFLGGGMESIRDVVRRGPILLCVIGALAVLAGIVLAVWAKRVVLGLAIAGGGGGLIAAGVLFEAYPWVLLIALAVVLGLGVWWVVDAKFAGKAKAALSAIVRGVEAAPDDAQAAVKDSIASAATATGQYSAVKDTITQAKNQAGVG